MLDRCIIPVILCGGEGSRLWPLSRKSYPKQFIKIGSQNKYSLLQNTQLRISKIEKIKEPILICNQNHRFIAAEQMREINVKPQTILLEPFGRNTCPAVTLAALSSLKRDKDSYLLVLAADHEIINNEIFIKSIMSGLKYCDSGRLVTFGIMPTHPETGYGYIKSKKPLNYKSFEGSEIASFLKNQIF